MSEKIQIKNDKPEKRKKSKYAAYMYAAVAVCITAVMTVSIFSLSLRPGEKPELQISLPDIPAPDFSIPDDNPVDAKPSVPDESDIPTGGGDTDVDTQKPEYVVPAEGTIIKKFSNDALVFCETMNDFRTHNGVDIRTADGAPVKSYTKGKIEKIYEDPMMGTVVVIAHDYGVKSFYKSLKSELPEGIKEGADVECGQIIGFAGNTAKAECAQGSHLHFEITVNGVLTDAYKEIKAING